MSKRYEKRFNQLKAEGKRAFMPFTVLGWPSREVSFKIIKQMVDCGASALELGIAFSDPIADGPIIQNAATETLAAGFKLDDALHLIKDIRKIDEDIPIGILVYFNMVLAQGVKHFFEKAKDAGVDGILVADLPCESAEEILVHARETNIAPIFLVSPLTTPDRLQTILQYASGFIYLISRLGVTGTHSRSDEKDASLKGLIKKIKSMTDVPICAGFGISTPENAKTMLEMGADGVISGSKVIELVGADKGSTNFSNLADYYKAMLSVIASSSSHTPTSKITP
jgi:tryptophan synthase alpha chain